MFCLDPRFRLYFQSLLLLSNYLLGLLIKGKTLADLIFAGFVCFLVGLFIYADYILAVKMKSELLALD